MTALKAALRKIWTGEEKSWKVFWLWGWAVSSLIYIASFPIAKAFPALGYGFDIVFLVLSVLLLIGMWRCAFNVKWRGWGYLARGYVVIVGCLYLTVPYYLAKGETSYDGWQNFLTKKHFLTQEERKEVNALCEKEISVQIKEAYAGKPRPSKFYMIMEWYWPFFKCLRKYDAVKMGKKA